MRAMRIRAYPEEDKLYYDKLRRGCPDPTFDNFDPPIPGTSGKWVLMEDFSGRKSFGIFFCITCDKYWFTAHATKGFKQSCKSCEQKSYPFFMWQNDRASRDMRDEARSDRLKGPHDQERCDACKAGGCVRGSEYN